MFRLHDNKYQTKIDRSVSKAVGPMGVKNVKQRCTKKEKIHGMVYLCSAAVGGAFGDLKSEPRDDLPKGATVARPSMRPRIPSS